MGQRVYREPGKVVGDRWVSDPIKPIRGKFTHEGLAKTILSESDYKTRVFAVACNYGLTSEDAAKEIHAVYALELLG